MKKIVLISLFALIAAGCFNNENTVEQESFTQEDFDKASEQAALNTPDWAKPFDVKACYAECAQYVADDSALANQSTCKLGCNMQLVATTSSKNVADCEKNVVVNSEVRLIAYSSCLGQIAFHQQDVQVCNKVFEKDIKEKDADTEKRKKQWFNSCVSFAADVLKRPDMCGKMKVAADDFGYTQSQKDGCVQSASQH